MAPYLILRVSTGGSGMVQHTISKTHVNALIALTFLVSLVVGAPRTARADEGGVSFWLPGIYGSLAAAPQQPGWSLPLIYYHASVSQSGSIAAAKEVRIGNLSSTLKVNLDLNVNADLNLGLIIPTYVFATPVLGGQLAVGAIFITGANSTSLDGTLTAMLGPFARTRTGTIDSSLTGFGDIFPQASLRWNNGVHNFMIYGTGDIPVGAYDPTRLANLGIGHGAIDGGFGYTYLNPQSGFEASVVTGFTGNFENPDTNYTNGVDWHLDWGASQFLSKQFFIGAVGYFYQQITADSGQAAFLGSNESRVIGVGPQLGYIFPISEQTQGYLNVKGYYEFDSYRRPEGWNLWVTFAISPAAPAPPSTR
jgi:hypothetical protein